MNNSEFLKRPLVVSAYQWCAERSKLIWQPGWASFDRSIESFREYNDAPAFIQELTIGGLWCIQKLIIPTAPSFSYLHRLFFKPPPIINYERYYDGWPGDHRGWMRFQSSEEARDYYRLAERLISFEEYKKIPHEPFSGVTINLDSEGNFALDQLAEDE